MLSYKLYRKKECQFVNVNFYQLTIQGVKKSYSSKIHCTEAVQIDLDKVPCSHVMHHLKSSLRD